MIDKYKDFFLVHDRTNEWIDKDKNQLPQVLEALKNLFQAGSDKVVMRRRERQEGLNQYEKIDQTDKSFPVRESQALLKVNLYDYLDTGLFLDHRPMRQTVFKQCQTPANSQPKKFLNLFCYTGAVSVFGALAGAQTTSVDMSATYLDWAKENFRLNSLDLGNHQFIQADVLAYLRDSDSDKYDVIFLDPPTFSNSKRMEQDFEVEKDQVFLVKKCMQRLAPGGVLYFSNNKRNFRIDEDLTYAFRVRDITKQSIPQDFHDLKIHCCFEIRELPPAKI